MGVEFVGRTNMRQASAMGRDISKVPVEERKRVPVVFSEGLPLGTIFLWGNVEKKLPDGFVICDGEGGVPDLKGEAIKDKEGKEKAFYIIRKD